MLLLGVMSPVAGIPSVCEKPLLSAAYRSDGFSVFNFSELF